jgi:hypothetical protein
MSWDSDSDGRFSNSEESVEDIVDLTVPTPLPKKKRLITEFFKPTKSGPPRSGGTPYFLQRYNPHPTLASGPSMGHTILPSSSTTVSIPAASDTTGTRSAVYKSYTLVKKLEVLQYVAKTSETEASRHFGISRTTIQGWKGLDQQPRNKSTIGKKGKNKGGAGRPITYGEEVDMALYQWVLEMRDLNLPVHDIQIKRKATEMIKTSHPLFKAYTVQDQTFACESPSNIRAAKVASPVGSQGEKILG